MTETPPPGKSSSESDDCDEAVILEYNNDNDDNYNMDADMMMLFIFFTCPIHLHQSFSEMFPYSVTPGYITDDGDGVGSPGSNTSGFFLLILVTMSALRMMMMMSAMMTLEICRKQRHRPHAAVHLFATATKLSSCPRCSFSSAAYQSIKWFVHCADFILY